MTSSLRITCRFHHWQGPAVFKWLLWYLAQLGYLVRPCQYNWQLMSQQFTSGDNGVRCFLCKHLECLSYNSAKTWSKVKHPMASTRPTREAPMLCYSSPAWHGTTWKQLVWLLKLQRSPLPSQHVSWVHWARWGQGEDSDMALQR